MQQENDNRKMVYRGREDRVHIADGKRAEMGEALAHELGVRMRSPIALKEEPEFPGDSEVWRKPLCPGCYMTALVNAAVTLAKENGQSLTELGNTLAAEFARPARSLSKLCSNALCTPEAQLIVCLLTLLCTGAGALSLDALLQ